jgi:glycerol-3-phosphate cytidylyltransferase
VDDVVMKDISYSFLLWKKYHYDKVFFSSEVRGCAQVEKLSALLREVGAEIVFVPYTEGISSSVLRERLKEELRLPEVHQQITADIMKKTIDNNGKGFI